ncbi:MAG: hypothetical protein L0I76_25975, partial [Pseudonocardia sp.]|nr:hypothetical protein [Pseudonocardia sp.]
ATTDLTEKRDVALRALDALQPDPAEGAGHKPGTDPTPGHGGTERDPGSAGTAVDRADAAIAQMRQAALQSRLHQARHALLRGRTEEYRHERTAFSTRAYDDQLQVEAARRAPERDQQVGLDVDRDLGYDPTD